MKDVKVKRGKLTSTFFATFNVENNKLCKKNLIFATQYW